MRFAIFGDIHSNLEALQTFLRVIEHEPDLTLVCLGDVVGYSSSPNECLEMLFEREVPIVMGNHERALIRANEREKYIDIARLSLDWQYAVIQREYLEKIAAFPYVIQYGRFEATHSNFFLPTDFVYVYTPEEADDSLHAMSSDLGFFGHTHIPCVFQRRNTDAPQETQWEIVSDDRRCIHLQPQRRYLINPGSLGQPRDGDPRGAYVIYDPDDQTVTFHRIAYDYAAECKRILDAKLPEILGLRLFEGF